MRCTECGKEEYLLFTCNYCGNSYCSKHRLPESHNCYNFKKVLKKHEQAWKHGKASVKLKSEYAGSWDENVKEINQVEEPKQNHRDVTNPCPNCGNQMYNHNIQCSICGREFCSKKCANPKQHGCATETKHEKENKFDLLQTNFFSTNIILKKISYLSSEVYYHLTQEFFLLLILFIISFFTFGLYFGDQLKTNLILAIILIGVNLYLIKDILEERGRYAKIALIIIFLLFSYFAAQQYSESIFEYSGVNSFITSINTMFTSQPSEKDYPSNNGITDKTIITSLNKTLDSTISSATDTISELTKPPDISEIEQLIYQKTNELRQSKKLNKLTWHAQLAQIARAHSLDMSERNFFEHENPDGDGPTERAQKAGISTTVNYGSYYKIGIGENISMVPIASNVVGCSSTYSEEGIAECAFDGWVNSPGHYANMIDSQYTSIGVGVAIVNGTAYLTQDFR